MSKSLVVLLAALVASVERHPRPPSPLRPILDSTLFQKPRPPPPPAPPRHLQKVISAATCNLLNGFGWNGPGVSETFGMTAMGAGDYAVNPNTASTAPAPLGSQPTTVILFCDARLPAEAVAVDYAELEYFAASEVGNTPPSLYEYLDVRAPDGTGYFYSQTLSAGTCTGPLSELYSGTNPVTTCATQTYVSLGADAGALSSTSPPWIDLSVHFLVFLPPSPDPTLPNVAYRIVVHYEAP